MESLFCSVAGVLAEWDPRLLVSPGKVPRLRVPPPRSRPHIPSLEPLADATTEDEADPRDGLPTGLECLPPRPGGFSPLGFCMAVPRGGQTEAGDGHILPAIPGHLWTEHKRDGVITSSLGCGKVAGGPSGPETDRGPSEDASISSPFCSR